MLPASTLSTPEKLPDPERLIGAADVCAIICSGRSWLYARVKAGDFPQPVRFGSRFTRWRAGEVYQWIATLERGVAA